MTEVERHWGLCEFPFREGSGSAVFVPTPTHAEAVVRIRQAAASGDRLIWLEADGGLGKTTVLDRALDDLRTPRRRIVRASAAGDGPTLLAELASGLGVRARPGMPWAVAWKGLTDAVRLCQFQELSIVLALDDCHEADDRRVLDRLNHLQVRPPARLTILRVGRGGDPETDRWGPLIRLLPLTRTEAAQYLTAKLAASGRNEPTFTPRAIARIHALARGVPRALDRLAALALREGARRGGEIVGPELIEEAAVGWIAP